MLANSLPPERGDEVLLQKGASLGRYVVLGLLGRGGMGEVYAAYDPELDRKIAVKLLRARGGGHSAEDGRARLLREAQAIARLSHPNVVIVHDVGTFKESVFVAMEFVQGHTLGYWLQAAARPWREVLDVYMAAGRGLVAAHAADLVHRDFKPENVMLTDGGQVRVMDFGLARDQRTEADLPAGRRVLDEDAIAPPAKISPETDPDATARIGGGGGPIPPASGRYLKLKLTQTGTILGTPAYMAPEQFAGSSGDARADQFAFCVALYEGLYGERPFAGANAVALMANVVAGAVQDPPADTRVPAWIRKVLLRGLSTDRDNRYPSMTELLADLARNPAGRRRRGLAIASGVLLLAGLAAGAQRISAGQHALCAGGPARAATVWGPPQRQAVERAFAATHSRHATQALAGASAAIDGYVARWIGMHQEACEATQVRGEQSADVMDLRMGCLGERLSSVRALADVFTSADPTVVENAVAAAGALPTLDRCADVSALRAVIRPPDDPATRLQVEKLREGVAQVNVLASAGRCDQAKAAGRGIETTAHQLGYRPLEAEISYAIGRLFDTCLDAEEALATLEDAVMTAEASHHDEIAIEASLMLATAHATLKHDVHAAQHWARHGEAILARFPGHPLLEARVAVSRGEVLHREGKFEEALKEERRALAVQEAILGPSSIDVAMTANNAAIVLHELGRDEEAADAIRRAREILSAALGEDTGRVALAAANEAEILTALKRFDAAEAAIDKALRILRQEGATTFFVGVCLLYKGELALAKQDPRAAVSTLEEALRLLGRQDAPLTAQAEFALARALAVTARDQRTRTAALARSAREALSKEPSSRRLLRALDEWERQRPGG